MTDSSSSPPTLDLAWLAAQTFGDVALQRDLLLLFDAQCEKLTVAMPGEGRTDALHTLRGGALAVGATALARLCGDLERDGRRSDAALAPAVAEVRAAMAAWHSANPA